MNEQEEFMTLKSEKRLLKKEMKIREVIYRYCLSLSLSFKTTTIYLESLKVCQMFVQLLAPDNKTLVVTGSITFYHEKWKILLKELISSCFVIHSHKLTILQAHQYGISRVYLACWGYLRCRKVKYSGKFEDLYKSIHFQPVRETSSEKKLKGTDLNSMLGLYFVVFF